MYICLIFTGIIVTKYNLPLTLGAIQTFIVAVFSLVVGLIYEEFIFKNILNEIDSILYAGVLSGGFAFVLQIYAQKNITPAPAAIIFSLEGVFATIAAWFLLSQVLDINNLIGCFFILSDLSFATISNPTPADILSFGNACLNFLFWAVILSD